MDYKKLLPDYPRTRHLSYNPNAKRNDLVCSEKECKIIFENEETYLEDKVDGASLGINITDGQPLVRNRNNFLQKGKTGHLRTSAKLQFAPVWNYFYDNIHKFEKLCELMDSNSVSIYGEWTLACHSIKYDALPEYFVAYDVYDWQQEYFLNTGLAREFLSKSGFTLPTLLHKGKVSNWDLFDKLCKEKSEYSNTDVREGVYVKVCDKFKIEERFKIVRHGFIQGDQWDNKVITKNKLKGS